MERTQGVLPNAVLLVVSGLAERAASFAVALILSRSVGASGLGVYVTVIAYFQLLSVAAELGVSNHLVREIAKDPAATGRWLSHACQLALVAGTVVAAAVLLLVPHVGLDGDVRRGTTVVVVGLVPVALNVVSRAVFVAHQRVVHDAGANLVASAALVASGWLLLRAGAGVLALIASYVAARAVVTAYSLVVIHRRIVPLRFDGDRDFAWRMLRGLRPFAGSSVVGALFARPELLLLSVMGTPRQVGYFGAAFKVVDLWQLLPETYMLNAYPVLTRAHAEDPDEAAAIQRRTTTGLLTLGLPLAAGVGLTARPIIELLYGPGFDEAVTLLRLMAVLAALFCVHTVLWRSLSARGEQSTVLRIQVRTLVIRLVLAVVLIRSLGAVGAAVSVPLALGLHNALLARALRGRGPGVVDLRQLWPAGAATAAMAAAVLVLVPGGSLLGSAAVAVPVYVATLALLLRRSSVDAPPVLVPVPEREPT